MPITNFSYTSNFLDKLTIVLETLICYLKRFYLSRKEKCENYGHTPILQALATVPVPVTESGTGTGYGDRA